MTVNILLQDPKKAFNVGAAVRAATAYGADGVLYTGDRLVLGREGIANPRKATRLPREERVRGAVPYGRIGDDEVPYFLRTSQRAGSVVIVELLHGAEPLPYFEHPTGDTLYVFGPEDGTVTKEWRQHADRFVFIPTRHCINLAAAVYTVLYDRQTKEQLAGRLPVLSMEETLA